MEPSDEVGRADGPAGERILVVDDDPFIARLLEIELSASGYSVRVAHDGEQALQIAREVSPDLVLCDVMMPNMDGFELTRRLRQDARTSSVSIIMLTARGLSSDKLEGFSIGADDYIVKPFDTPELLARIRGVLRRSKEMRAQSPLTGLPGNVRIEEEIEARVRDERNFAILYADLDNFKAFNDHYGFMRGDQVIQFTSRVLQEVALEIAGDDAFVGHVGGDDFVVVCGMEQGVPTAERIVERFDAEAPALYDPEERARGFIEVENRRGEVQRFPLVSISIGIASTERRRYSHHAEAVAIATEMKGFTKLQAPETSSWAIDRRTS
ncbi:MAG TPA: response regulator [Actinomycetota bacterium]|nr:response regulator [Actinomycetota bacterium]